MSRVEKFFGFFLDVYEDLSRTQRDIVDQTLHFLAGLAIATVGTAAAAWAWSHHREFVQQAPIERIYDTERDDRFVLYGAALGQGINLTWVSILASAIF